MITRSRSLCCCNGVWDVMKLCAAENWWYEFGQRIMMCIWSIRLNVENGTAKNWSILEYVETYNCAINMHCAAFENGFWKCVSSSRMDGKKKSILRGADNVQIVAFTVANRNCAAGLREMCWKWVREVAEMGFGNVFRRAEGTEKNKSMKGYSLFTINIILRRVRVYIANKLERRVKKCIILLSTQCSSRRAIALEDPTFLFSLFPLFFTQIQITHFFTCIICCIRLLSTKFHSRH